MNGPQHYAEAERLLEAAAETYAGVGQEAVRNKRLRSGDEMIVALGDGMVTAAQVHATLALAAATAEPIAREFEGAESDGAIELTHLWSEAIS